jgi:hypothetical protein
VRIYMIDDGIWQDWVSHASNGSIDDLPVYLYVRLSKVDRSESFLV